MNAQSRIIAIDNGEPCWNTTGMDNLPMQSGEPLGTGHVNQRRPAGNGEPVLLSENDISAIRERFHGWERASAKTLSAVFGVTVQKITAIVQTTPTQSLAGRGELETERTV